MNQITVLPLPSCQSRSYLPSPSKSRWPTIDQVLGTPPKPPADRMDPLFIVYKAMLPFWSRQTMSLFPSPLMSCVAAERPGMAPVILANQ